MSLNHPKKRVRGGHRHGTGAHGRPGIGQGFGSAADPSQPCRGSRPRRRAPGEGGTGGPQSHEGQRAEAEGRAGNGNLSVQEETYLPSKGLGGLWDSGNG